MLPSWIQRKWALTINTIIEKIDNLKSIYKKYKRRILYPSFHSAEKAAELIKTGLNLWKKTIKFFETLPENRSTIIISVPSMGGLSFNYGISIIARESNKHVIIQDISA
ncbi:hypothetical protein BB558_001579 [Smittium angustum]|uniref:Uncharacterized protein n=1 Tax=Smittium angustum TaxID=133377 RepID=A0A2U1JBA2_SMIAN|nr:hypothetical protein BB558_001579 [Smittium angustum]